MSTQIWQSAAGSICGAEHRRTGRCNQDAFAVREAGGVLVAVVTDGCGSAAHSQVGSHLGASLWAEALLRHAGEAEVVSHARDEVVAHLALLAESMGPDLGRVVSDYFLFTTIAAVAHGEEVVVFAIGDGYACIDGQVIEVGPFFDNRPPYVGYELLGRRQPLATIWRGRAAEIVLASDGAVPPVELSTLCQRSSLLGNRDGLRRYLAGLNRESISVDWDEEVVERSYGRLADDTTLVLLRRAR